MGLLQNLHHLTDQDSGLVARKHCSNIPNH